MTTVIDDGVWRTQRGNYSRLPPPRQLAIFGGFFVDGVRAVRAVRDFDHGDDVLYAAFQAGQMRGFGSGQRRLKRPLDSRFERPDFVFEAAGSDSRNGAVHEGNGVLSQWEDLDANVHDPVFIQPMASFWAAIPK